MSMKHNGRRGRVAARVVRWAMIVAALGVFGCSSLPTGTRDASVRDGADITDTGATTTDVPATQDVPVVQDVSPASDAPGADVPVGTDAGVVDVPPPVDAGPPTGLRLLRAGVVTVGPATAATGPLQIVDQGFEGADRQCSGALCWTGSVEP